MLHKDILQGVNTNEIFHFLSSNMRVISATCQIDISNLPQTTSCRQTVGVKFTNWKIIDGGRLPLTYDIRLLLRSMYAGKIRNRN